MKKALVAILSILFLTVSSGIIINFHYCMGRLSSVTYGAEDTHKCGTCGMLDMNKKGCCNTEFKLVKIQDYQNIVQDTWKFSKLNAETPLASSFLADFLPASIEYLALYYHSPPDKRLNSVYLHNSVFRI